MFNYKKTLILGQDENSIEVVPRISSRARRISIKVSGHNGVELIIPKNVSTKKALKFLYSKEEWILKKSLQIRKVERVAFGEGSRLPIDGNLYTIFHSGKIRGITYIDGSHIIVSGPKEFIPRKVLDFLKDLAKKEITSRAQVEALKLGVKYSRLTVRDTRSRWGSCSHKKNLSFSWRLILAPREVLEYVVAHEISHLKEMSHNKVFWNIVENVYPEHRQARKWLKENGTTLHVYG